MSVNKNMNILVVEDDRIVLEFVKEQLRHLGFSNIELASSGAEALQKTNGKNYDLIISDWNMENISGLDLLKEVRSKGSKVPFIMATSDSKKESVMIAREAGVSNYIVKPFDAKTLKAKLASVIGKF